MSKWYIDYIEYATKGILYLLRDQFMCATNYNEMRKIFLEEPCRLYTKDIQKCFIHLSLKFDDLKYIPIMNRRFYSLKTIVLNKYKTYFEIIGIKNISLNLNIPIVC